MKIRDARRLAISSQHLDGKGAKDLTQALRALRCLQLDPIAVVASSHHLVLRSRLEGYDPGELERQIWEDRKLFEYWAHAASLVLTEDYPLHQALMRVYPRGQSAYGRRVKEFFEGNTALHKHILERLREDGPLPAGAFEDRAAVPWVSGGWTSGRNVERMLDVLWFRGEIMVAARSGGKRLWDFAFRTEMYVPKANRRYGYYVLPILHGERLIGRVAPRFDRRKGVLEVEGVYAEPHAAKSAGRAVRRAIEELATFVGAGRVDYIGPVPGEWRAALTRS